MPKLQGVAKLEAEFHLMIRSPNGHYLLMLDDRWTIEKIDETHLSATPSLDYGNDGDDFAFHTTKPFIIEVVETKLTRKRS